MLFELHKTIIRKIILSIIVTTRRESLEKLGNIPDNTTYGC